MDLLPLRNDTRNDNEPNRLPCLRAVLRPTRPAAGVGKERDGAKVVRHCYLTVDPERGVSPAPYRARRMVYHGNSWYTIRGQAGGWRGHATPRSALGLQKQGT